MSNLEQALEECLTKLSNGEAKLEDCLAHYPEHADELRRLLVTADYVKKGRAIQPAPIFKARTRAKVIAHVNANSHRSPAKRGLRIFPSQFRRIFGKTFSLAFNLTVILCLFLLTGSVLAQTASPGDRLYDWRLATEELWRAYHPNPINANLTLAKRHAQDVLDAARSNNPALEELAIQDYQNALNELSNYDVTDSRDIISRALHQQKAHLAEAQVDVPALDQLLDEVTPKAYVDLSQEIASVEGGRITYSFSITNQGPTSPVSAILTNRLSPEQTLLVSTAGNACRVTPGGLVECAIPDLPTGTTHNFTITTEVDPCYIGPVTNTAKIATGQEVANLNRTQEVTAEHEVTWTFPGPSRIVYVQSDNRHHNLVGTITGSASPLSANLQEWAAAPAWSPDGTKLAFFGEEGISQLGSPFDEGNGVWMMDIIAGQAWNPRLFVAEDHVKNIVWSPDGTKLAFEVGPPNLTHEIVVVDTSNGQPLNRFSGEQPAWSPDSSQLVMKACQPECGLWRVNLDGSGATRLTFGDSDSYPAWSPTGQYLAFTSDREEGNWEIYLLALADKQLLRLTHRPGTDITPVFGPCGREVYLRTDHYGGWRITAMTLDGSEETTVVEGVGNTDDWGLARPAIHFE